MCQIAKTLYLRRDVIKEGSRIWDEEMAELLAIDKYIAAHSALCQECDVVREDRRREVAARMVGARA